MVNFQNIELEAHVIGGCVTDCARFKRARGAGLSADAFTDSGARAVWQTMEELDNQREAFDGERIMARMPKLSVFLAGCMDIPTFALFDDWVIDLRNLAAARTADAALLDARAKLAEEPLKPDKIQAILEAIPPTYQRKAAGHRQPTLQDTKKEYLDQREERTKRDIPLLKGWGQSVFHSGEVFVLGELSGKGKTAFATTAVNEMLDSNLSVLYCCSESSRVDIFARIVAARCGIPHWKKQKELTAEERRAHDWALDEVMKHERRLFIYGMGDGVMTPDAVRGCMNRFSAQCGRVDVFVIDYLQDFDLEKARSGMTQTNIMEEVIKRLHSMAGETGAACLALSQYNKEAEKLARGDEVPQKWWLMDASKIEHAAHVIAALWLKKDGYYLKCIKYRNCSDFNIKLASNGAGFVLDSPSPMADHSDIPEVDF